MPTVEQNRETWETYEWAQGGDEWSWEWGGPAPEWYGTILPRIHRWLPAGTVLEIAPGFGRWTQYLKDLADHLVVVDLSDRCVAACRERFAGSTNISYHVNDGRSLGMVEDGSVDFAISFDSLVHVEADVLQSYLDELARVLAPDGVAFLHHSNLAAHMKELRLGRRSRHFPERVQRWLERTGRSTKNRHVRAESVSADLVAGMAASAQLSCPAQEIITWGGPVLHDCLSVVTPVGSRWARQREILVNPGFAGEVRMIGRRESLYPAPTAGSGTPAERGSTGSPPS